jgi:hypothetical protein
MNDSVTVSLYAKNAFGRPGDALFSATVALKSLKARWDRGENYVLALPAPVKVGDVFAGLRLPADPRDTLALSTSDNSQTYETAWERSFDGSWTTVLHNWSVSLNLGVALRYVSEEAMFDPADILTFGSENVFTLLYDSPAPEAVMWVVDGQIVGESKNTILTGLGPGEHTYTLYVRRGVCVHEISGVFETMGVTSTSSFVTESRPAAYPNPNDGTFRVVGATAGTVLEVFSADGRKVGQTTVAIDAETEFRLAVPGVYLVKLNRREGTHTLKVVVTP